MKRTVSTIFLVILFLFIVSAYSIASNDFTQEIAQRVVIVAMTNCQAIDVFMDDGNRYDQSKFHSYADETESKMDVYEEGVWTAIDEKTWHVDNLKLVMPFYDTYLKVTCDVTFDGTTYLLSNGTKVLANLKYLDSDDDSWQAIEEINPKETRPYFTVSPELIIEDRKAN